MTPPSFLGGEFTRGASARRDGGDGMEIEERNRGEDRRKERNYEDYSK